MEHLSTAELIDRELDHARHRIALAHALEVAEPTASSSSSSAGPTFLLILGVIIGLIAITAPAPWLGAPVAIALGAGGYYRLEDARARRRARRRHLHRGGYLDLTQGHR